MKCIKCGSVLYPLDMCRILDEQRSRITALEAELKEAESKGINSDQWKNAYKEECRELKHKLQEWGGVDNYLLSTELDKSKAENAELRQALEDARCNDKKRGE